MCACDIYITSLSIHQSTVDGHLGSFHILAIVDIAAINIGVHVPFQITIFIFLYPLDKYLVVQLLDLRVALFLTS